jgi:hypothetical protein
MESTTRSKVTTIAVASLMALALAGGSAFAGTNHSSGWNKESGNKNGNDNKKYTYTCPSDEWWLDYSNGYWYDAYDLNQNSYVCITYANDEYNYADDTAKQD